ncbi:MAG: SDR family oxidoreductase [Acidobacteriota bacterium]
MSTVLVTGGSGFIGSHCILQLLEAGHTVRTTVRSLDREADVRAMLAPHPANTGHVGGPARVGGAEPGERLTFFAADLLQDEGWAAALQGCEYVLHVASPFPSRVPDDENEIVRPAVEGTLRVLRAARDAGVKRVVLTSSFAAIGYGHKQQDAPFTEASWTNLQSDDVLPYVKSKTLAEHEAWNFMGRERGGLELAVVNPVGVFGPVLGPDLSTSILIVQRLMEGAVPGCPKIWFGAVDVRDVADLHLRAMTHPEAKGDRFLAVAGDFMSFREIALVLKSRMGEWGKKVPTVQIPNWAVRLVAKRDPAARQILPELDKRKNATSEHAQKLLGWKPRSREDAIVATAESLVQLGLVRGSR